MAEALVSGTILAATLALVLMRPWGVSEAWWAAVGGAMVLSLGLVSFGEVGEIFVETADPLVLLVGMMALSTVAERAGLFGWAASIAARAGRGRVLLLYGFVFLAGTLVTATLSLDATAIVLTPVVYEMVVRLRLNPVPFVFACVYTANTASLFLPVSNLTNLLAYNALDPGFARFGLVMLLPATLAVVANALVFFLLFRGELRGNYEPDVSPSSPKNRTFFGVAAGGLAAVLAAFFVAPLWGATIGPVALIGGLLVAATARVAGWVRLREVASSVSWGIIPLVLGLFIVVRAVQEAGLADLAREAFAVAAPGDGFLQILAVAGGAALGSNLMNNLPMAQVALDASGPLLSEGRLGPGAPYAVLIGTNVGPNLTIVGSMATLIWLSIVRGKGLRITAGEYLKVGVLATPAILLSAAAGLWLSLRLLGG